MPTRFAKLLSSSLSQAAAICLLCGALFWLPAWQTLEKRGFDLLTVLTAPGTTPLPIILIAIDDASLAEVPHAYP
jgi:CHASE2 domain-containing sensor protein